MLHPYKHPLFSQWLSTVMLPEAQALFEEAELLLVNHYNTDEGMNLFNDNLLSQVDQLDTVDMVSQAQAYLIDNCITAIQEYGILIETPIDSSKFEILLAIFRTAMTIDTYEDPMAINQFLELGNSNNELFGEFVHLLYPNIQVEEVLPLLKEVFATFMDTIRANIKEVVLKQQELDEEDLREENQAKLKFIQGYEKTLKAYGIQLPQGVNRKSLKQVLRDFFTNITDSDEYEDYLNEALYELINGLNQRTVLFYACTYAYLFYAVKSMHSEAEIDYSGVPDYDIIDDQDKLRNFVQSCMTILKQLEQQG